MKKSERLNYFNEALSRLQSGENLQSILKLLPQDYELLEMIRVASYMNIPPYKIPDANRQRQDHSKQEFLQAALQLGTKSPSHGFLGWLQGLRVASQMALIFVVIIVSLSITGIVSVQALPGQALYGVKRFVEQTQLALTRDSLGRLQLEEVQDARRVNEVLRLQLTGSRQSVSFAGWMKQNADGSWQVQGIPVVLDEESPFWNPMLNGSYVEVNGVLSQDGVIIRDVELRLFKLHGTLQLVEPDGWQVNGIPLKISPETQTQVLISTGMVVDVTAIRLDNDQFMALVINIAGPAETPREITQTEPESSVTPSPKPSNTMMISTLPNTVMPAFTIQPVRTTVQPDIISSDSDMDDDSDFEETQKPFTTEESEHREGTPESTGRVETTETEDSDDD